MPLDASDRTRRIQDITIFQGYAIAKQTQQPGVNVSTCAGFNSPSTIKQFTSYEVGYDVRAGLVYFSTCQGGGS
jgi:hypothetical protein